MCVCVCVCVCVCIPNAEIRVDTLNVKHKSVVEWPYDDGIRRCGEGTWRPNLQSAYAERRLNAGFETRPGPELRGREQARENHTGARGHPVNSETNSRVRTRDLFPIISENYT